MGVDRLYRRDRGDRFADLRGCENRRRQSFADRRQNHRTADRSHDYRFSAPKYFQTSRKFVRTILFHADDGEFVEKRSACHVYLLHGLRQEEILLRGGDGPVRFGDFAGAPHRQQRHQ